jgi:GDP-4-dehydro-6-deoxy-D-mannose reductase
MAHRALITGATGFAGSFLAEHLLQCGDAVLGCSSDGLWDDRLPRELRRRVELVAWDLASPEGGFREARRRIEQFRPDWIFHLAAISVPEDCGPDEPTPEAMAVNVEGTRRVLELAASLRPRPRVLFTSSSRVYGPADPQSPRVDEAAQLAPQRGYGRTKLAAEEEVRRATAGQACDAVIARAFQHTGPRQSSRMMLPQWAEQFARGDSGPIAVYTLNAWIDLTDVRDVVRAYRLLAERGRRGEVYNVGSGVSRRTGEVFDVLRAVADPDRPVVETRPRFKQNPIADVTRLVHATGWGARIPLEQTVADTLAWWRRRVAQGSGKDAPGETGGR